MHGPDIASAWVQRFAPLIARDANVLDVACGNGRHARLFARRGCVVDAVDRDPACGELLADEPNVRFLAADLEEGPWPYAGRRFDAIVVANYLHRPLFPQLVASLADGGVLIYETFAAGNERYGRPSNPDFLLKPRELLDAFGVQLHVLAFEDGVVDAPRPARIQRLCGVRASADAHERLRLDAPD
ncbi:MAG: hypothetical protein AMXMBFR72_12150 [Betaproteobacteria bacterium]